MYTIDRSCPNFSRVLLDGYAINFWDLCGNRGADVRDILVDVGNETLYVVVPLGACTIHGSLVTKSPVVFIRSLVGDRNPADLTVSGDAVLGSRLFARDVNIGASLTTYPGAELRDPIIVKSLFVAGNVSLRCHDSGLFASSVADDCVTVGGDILVDGAIYGHDIVSGGKRINALGNILATGRLVSRGDIHSDENISAIEGIDADGDISAECQIVSGAGIRSGGSIHAGTRIRATTAVYAGTSPFANPSGAPVISSPAMDFPYYGTLFSSSEAPCDGGVLYER